MKHTHMIKEVQLEKFMDVTRLWDLPDDTSYMDCLDEACSFLKNYDSWRFEGAIEAMELRCFSTELSDGSKIIAEEHMYSQGGEKGYNVIFFHVTDDIQHPHDGFTTEKTLAEYIAKIMKREQ